MAQRRATAATGTRSTTFISVKCASRPVTAQANATRAVGLGRVLVLVEQVVVARVAEAERRKARVEKARVAKASEKLWKVN